MRDSSPQSPTGIEPGSDSKSLEETGERLTVSANCRSMKSLRGTLRIADRTLLLRMPRQAI